MIRQFGVLVVVVVVAACGGGNEPYDQHIVSEVDAAVVAIVDGRAGTAYENDSKTDGYPCRGLGGIAEDVAEQKWARWDLGEDFDLGLSLLEEIESYLAGRGDIDTLEGWEVTANVVGLTAIGDGYKAYSNATRSVTGQVTFEVATYGPCH